MPRNTLTTRTLAQTALVAGLIAAVAAPARAQSETDAANQINAANQLVRQGKFVEAIDAYGQAPNVPAQSDSLNYNLAIAHYRNGDVNAAAELFRDAARSSDSLIAANSRYNLGNCDYARALQDAEQNPQLAIESLESAISHYRESLRIDRRNADARANIELATQMIDRLQKQQQDQNQKSQQQNQDQQDQDQQDQDQQDQDQQDQDPQSDQEQQNQEQQNQGQQSQQQQDAQQENAPDQQRSTGSSSDRQSADSQDKSQENDSQQQKENQSPPSSQEASGKESSAERESALDPSPQQPENRRPRPQDQDQRPPESAGEDRQNQDHKPVPSGQLEAAVDQQSDNKQAGALAASDRDDDGLMTRQEALKMLQSVRDRDMIRRLRQQARQRSRRIPVDRDW